MKIELVPRVCQQLMDQANCKQVVELCGADANLDFCTAKLVSKEIGKSVIDPAPLAGVKAIYGVGKSTYHVTMQGGHDFLHTFAKDLIQNIGGDGKVHAVGGFISKVLGGSL